MSTNQFKLSAVALTVAAMLLPGGQAIAAEYWLKAQEVTVQMPSPIDPLTTVDVPMWGYASCDGAGTCGAATVPGPALTVPAGDTSLTVHLTNELSTPTSLVINGLIKPMTPVWYGGTSGPRTSQTQRVRSFDAEAGPNGGSAVYVWGDIGKPPVKPGTYLYQSGTQPQVQVQMGLYGAVTKNAVEAATPVRAESYAGLPYDNQATLLYSEIDPALHDAVATGSYGSTGPTSTFNYVPKYFLINGQPYSGLSNPVTAPVGSPGTTLLRFLNAGLTTHVPMIQGTHWTVVAEDGKPYPYSASQYTALLPAAKTLDVMLTPDIGGGTYPVIDRRLNLSNDGLSDGGMLTILNFAAQGIAAGAGFANRVVNDNVAPISVADNFDTVKGVTLSVGSPGVMVNDDNTDNLPQPFKAVVSSGTTLGNGTYVLHANGSFSYTPAIGFVGVDSFDYTLTDGKALSAPATVTISVIEPIAPALALLDNFNRTAANSLGTASEGLMAAWGQQASTGSPPDIGTNGDAAVANTVALGGLAILNQNFPVTQGASISTSPLSTLINSALVLKATGGTTATSPANLVRVRCEAANGGEVVVATMMGGSNVSLFARQAAFVDIACNSGGSLSAVVDGKGLVTTFLNGHYVGGVQLPDVAAWKGEGKIGIQLQTQGAAVDNFSGGSF